MKKIFDNLTLKYIIEIYLKICEFYEEKAYTRTLCMVSRKKNSQDSVNIRQHSNLKILMGYFDVNIENDK
jgi:hypothetical protein